MASLAAQGVQVQNCRQKKRGGELDYREAFGGGFESNTIEVLATRPTWLNTENRQERLADILLREAEF